MAQSKSVLKQRVSLWQRDGTFVRYTVATSIDAFLFCLRTGRYYDRREGTRFLERDWREHDILLDRMAAERSADPLDMARAAAGLPVSNPHPPLQGRQGPTPAFVRQMEHIMSRAYEAEFARVCHLPTTRRSRTTGSRV